MSRRLVKKNKRTILDLKIAYEDRSIAEEELAIGIIELTDILKEFRGKISDKQKNEFDRSFFGIVDDTPDDMSSISAVSIYSNTYDPSPSTDIEAQDVSPIKQQHPTWVKNLYKQIVNRSHPDRFVGFPIREIKEKYTQIYMSAVDAFNQGDLATLLVCANDVEVEVTMTSEISLIIQNAIKAAQQRVGQISGLLAYQWYHTEESNRINFIENYLSNLGYEFKTEKVEKVIRRTLIRRKPGTRPEKFRVKRK